MPDYTVVVTDETKKVSPAVALGTVGTQLVAGP